MKTLYEMIKDLTDITVEQDKISDYLENEALDLRGADLMGANLSWADLQGADLHGLI
ncbi:pentapeptide repeat-containing protein [Spiroplasma citri]|uniref:Pentapeptide repeat-containing protein n=1 Tax=Spiroplasma citri TaxID=2133 RepID=A0AAX3SW79_SPICI|nr:pentapeptide repeat-containing protein [Spiroplasma citri]WFG95422.1 pentapeptide repeat-containing protein [Spiroplasma citri]